MASKPGFLTQWPWQKLGAYKYVVITPWVAHSIYSYVTKPEGEKDLSNLLILPFLFWRWLHNQIWVSLSRFQTARSKHRIVQKGIDFEQVDREGNWDDQILLNGSFLYLSSMFLPGANHLPFWNTKGIVMTILIQMGPVEFLYYWAHRALHHHYLYARYHSHHHSSIVTEPITSVIHPFGEHLLYFALFTIPLMTMTSTRTSSIIAIGAYETYIDFMNNLGHCNFELVPKWLFRLFPPLKYLMYTPSFHSLHHTQFRTNYALFMPFYDYLYNTVDKSSESLYEASHEGRKETPDVVHLTHPTTLDSIYHLRLGFASFASNPYASKWYLSLIWPFTWLCTLLTTAFGSTFTIERNRLDKLKMQTWAIPRFSFQYDLPLERARINEFIEKAISEAEQGGTKVISLELLNQGEELNGNGELYLQKNPKLKVRIVDGTTLAVALVINSIPQGTKQVLMRGRVSKVSYAIAIALCQKGIQIKTVRKEEYENLKLQMPAKYASQLLLSSSYDAQIWLVGDGLRDEEQRRAPRDARFIPFSQFPPKRVRRDCVYHSTPALRVPKSVEDMHACENWLPRSVMSAWRVAGIVHALEGWETHECGNKLLDMDKVWNAALRHGFLPLTQGDPRK